MWLTGQVVTPDRVLPQGRITVEGGLITAVDAVPAGASRSEGRPAGASLTGDGSTGDRLTGDGLTGDGGLGGPDERWIVPGFVDLHNHGGGGHGYTSGVDAARWAAGFHLSRGTTTLLASLMAAPHGELLATATTLEPLISAGVLAGVHYEGPYLAPAQRGAQVERYLREPCSRDIGELLATGTAVMVTIAPELPGGIEAIEQVATHGTVAAIGHTDASHARTVTAIRAGARVATHLFNAMRPVHHREPGPVVALLAAPEVTCELIADGAHLHEAMLTLVVAAAGPARVALVSDAVPMAGRPDGRHRLPDGRPVTVQGSVARVTDASGEALLGGTTGLDSALRRLIRLGTAPVDAVRMVSTTPAATIGRADIGALTVGARADLVVLDRDWQVRRVMRAGSWTS